MGGSNSRSAQELHRSPPCTRLHCPDSTTRRQPRTAVGWSRYGQVPPPKTLPQQQCQSVAAGQKNSALRKGEVAVGRLRAGCESFPGHRDMPWPLVQAAGVKAQEGPGRQRGLQPCDGPLLWKTRNGVISELAHLTDANQRFGKLPPLPRSRSPGQREPSAVAPGRKSAAPAPGHVAERPSAARLPPAPPPALRAPTAAHRLDAAPHLHAYRDVSASYAGSSTSASSRSRSNLASDDSGISSSPSRVSLQSHHDECERENLQKPLSPRPPAWKVRGFHEDQIPSDLHQRFCEEIKSRYELQTEEDRRRRLLAITRVDALVSERVAASVGREVPAPLFRAQQRPSRCRHTSGDQGTDRGDRSNGPELRSILTSSATGGTSGNSEGRKSTQSSRDDIKAILRGPPVDQYCNYNITNSCKDRLQQAAEENHYRSLNGANVHQLPENYSQEQRQICDIFSNKLTMTNSQTEKDQVHKENTCLNHTKDKRMDADMGGERNRWGNTRRGMESIHRTVDVPQLQKMMSRDKRYGQNEKEGAIGDGERMQNDQNQPDNLLLQSGQKVYNDAKDRNAEIPQRDRRQADSRNAEEAKDDAVMQLLLGGYFRREPSPPSWRRVGALRRTSNQLDVSIRTCRDPVQRQSVETQTPPVHVSRRLTHADVPRLEFAPKIEVDHRGGFTRYYGLGRDGSIGSLLSTGTPASPPRPQTGVGAGLPKEERVPSYLVVERRPASPGASDLHSDLISHDRVPSAHWIAPETAFTSPHTNRYSQTAQSLANHMSENSTSFGLAQGLALTSELEVNNGSRLRDTTFKSTVARSSHDQSKEEHQTVEHKQGKESAWTGQMVPTSHSTPYKLSVNEMRVKTDQPFSRNKSNAETHNGAHHLALRDRKPLTPEDEEEEVEEEDEEELNSIRLDSPSQYNLRISLDDSPARFSCTCRGGTMQHSNANTHETGLHHRVNDRGEGDSKQKKLERHSDQHPHEKVRKRFPPRHPRHSLHQRNGWRRTKREDKFADPESVPENRNTHRKIQYPQRVTEKTDKSKNHRGRDSLDNELSANARFGYKGDSESNFRHNARNERIVQDEIGEETSDDVHVLNTSNGPSSDSLSKSSTSLLCHCCREHVQASTAEQCNVSKFAPDWKKTEKLDSRGSADRTRSCAMLRKPSVAPARNEDCRAKQRSPSDHNDEHVPRCRSSCCCTCHKTLGRPRFQQDVSGRQATHVAKRAHCSGAETPCCCREHQSVHCGADSRDLCSARRRETRSGSEEPGPASGNRSFHKCYCGSRRVCYSILEDEEEAAAAEEAQGGGRGFVQALSFFQSHSAGEWSQ